MKRSRKLIAGCLVSLLLLAVLAVIANFVFLDFVVDVLWYGSLGYLKLFFLKLGYKYFVLIGVTLFFFLLIFMNFWVASRYLGVTMWHKDAKVKSVIRGFRTGSLKIYTPLSLLLAIPLALPMYEEWENALLFFFAPATGVSDSLFHLDVSFYLFALPIIILLQGRLILTLTLLLVALAILYAVEMKVLSKERRPLYRGARLHLSLIIFLIFLVMCCGYGVEALMLQYTTANMPLFYGPGYAEIRWGLPILGLTAGLMFLAALSLMFVVMTRRGIKAFVVFGILALGAHFAKDWDKIPDSVNTYLVKPNELDKQKPYIDQTIQSTLTGYQLRNVERRPYRSLPVDAPMKALGESVELESIPLWDNELLGAVFQQLQAIRPYYQFSGVDAARYLVDDTLHQVYLAAREITVENLPDTAKTWVNKRMKYTHGYGLVMTPAAQSGEDVMKWYIKNMPPESDVGFTVKEPSIYYGMSEQSYVIAPNESEEFHYPGVQDEVLINYKGDGGVSIGTLWSKLLFSLYFKDRNLFFTNQTQPESRIHFRRNIQERIRILAPFLELDENPYLVVTPERLYWMQDAYTTSRWYPNSEPYHNQLNYIRNSVKIVVDAYTGKVDFYLQEENDPIARAYQGMYPGLIREYDEMPEALRKQTRYPKDLFEIQMRMYATYHQTDPETYYKGEDRMEFAEIMHQKSLIRMKPYYMTLDLIDPGRREFLLLTPLLPMNRDNLRALAVAGSDGDNYGRVILYTFPKGSQVFGPPQINALIDQHTEIAQNITLWNQEGSEVKRGKMIVLPVDGRILYIQPLYMEATGRLQIPQLKRVIVCASEKVVMDVSIEKAVKKLHELIESSSTQLPDVYVPPGAGAGPEELPEPEAEGGKGEEG